MDEYPNWLKNQDAESAGNDTGKPQVAPVSSKKQSRQDEARRRKQLKPYMDVVRKIDKQMSQKRSDLSGLEKLLAEESLYTDTSRKEEISSLLQQQAGLKSSLESLEWEWLEASESLEKAEKEL